MEATEDKHYNASQCVEAFTASIQHDTRIDADGIKGEMKDGAMNLRGNATNAVQSELAARTARGIPRVLRVSNKLKIREQNQFVSNVQDLSAIAPGVLKDRNCE